MSDKVLLEKISGIIITNNKVLLGAVDQKIRESEKRLEEKISGSEKKITSKLTKKIEDSQKDTLEVLSEMIHAGYNMHEKRIRRLEEVGISSPKL